jgi:hypothetical protein
MRLAVILALGSALSAFAQDKAAEPPKAPAMADMMPRPGPEMARMRALLGAWEVEETHEASAFGPGGKGKALSTVAPGPGGLSLRINYRSTEGRIKGFAGHGVLAWDESGKAYKQAWVDNMTPGLMVGTGQWEGDRFVVTTEAVMMGKPCRSRDTFSNITRDGFTLTSEMSLDGAPLAKMVTLVHRRRAEPAAVPAPARDGRK